jgi:hypothetical protein
VTRFIAALAGAACLALLASSPALANPPNPDNPAGKELGVVPVHRDANKFSRAGSNLSYHGGPVMRANRSYAIYWSPSGTGGYSANYLSVTNQFLGDVAADSGKTSNVYFSDTQYYDGTGPIAYSSTFGGSVLDTNAYPSNGCRDPYTSVCLTDSQLQAEISRVVSAQGWPRGTGAVYFLLTPRNVGSCYGSSCAYSYYCAYHSSFGSGSGLTLYANQPYANYVPAACGSGQHPNGDDADDTINVASHEHNEAITDPLGNAWYDSRGYENGDKCAWNFGSSLGSTGSGQYNQLINGHGYYLQQEWSNRSSRCVLTGT